MDDRNNTIFGWVLAGGIAALGSSIVSGMVFHADDPERPEQAGYVIEGVETAAEEDQGPALATLLASADAAAGERVFARCTQCHSINAGGPAGVGPNIHGIMGSPIAGGSFAYSEALASIGGNWTWEQMDAWIARPAGFASGTKMSFAGLSNPEDRADLLVYLNSQGSNIPLPPPPVVEEEAAEPAEGEAPAEGEEAPAEEAAEAEA